MKNVIAFVGMLALCLTPTVSKAQGGCGPCCGLGGLPGDPVAPSFTDTRTTPVGSDLLKVTGLVASDTWSVDLMMNTSNTQTAGQLNPDTQITSIWSGTGPGDASTTINTLSKLNLYYSSGIGYY